MPKKLTHQRHSVGVRRETDDYKSNFERLIANTLGGKVVYEPDTLPFIQPAIKRNYTPDFKVKDKVYIECKGIFTAEDRKKMLLVKEQYPDHKFYLLFYNAKSKLGKGSKTTYEQWCKKNGFECAHAPAGIPKEWFE